MIANPAARALLEFIQSRGLSVRAVAKRAGTSEAAIRHFRDEPGRKVHESTRISIAKALRVLTLERINIVELFGLAEDSPHQRTINSDKNIVFSSLLRGQKLTPTDLAHNADVPFNIVIDLLINKDINEEFADRIKNYFRTDEIYDRDQWWREVINTDSVMDDEKDLENKKPIMEMTDDEVNVEAENFSRAGYWWDKLIQVVRAKDRTAIGNHLGEGVPIRWLSSKQLSAVENVIKYYRESRSLGQPGV
jgi:AcrR family transcriptional regulator